MTTVKMSVSWEGDLYTKYAETWPPICGQSCDAAGDSATGERRFFAIWNGDEELERAIKWMRDWHSKTADMPLAPHVSLESKTETEVPKAKQ